MTIHDLWNECVNKTNDVPSCLELYTKEIRKQMIEEIQDLKKLNNSQKSRGKNENKHSPKSN